MSIGGDDPLAVQRLAAMRRQYRTSGFDVGDLAPTWCEQLRAWLADASRGGMIEPNAMVLATAGEGCAPSARTVLLKGLGDDGLVFYTNYLSRKGVDLEANPHAGIVFPWYELQRQVHAEGSVERIPAADSASYWASRPRGSQIGAAASMQSQVLGSRRELDDAAAELDERLAGRPVPRPEHWGGYRLVPHSVEFWQGRADRLHDRLRYRRADAGEWVVERLAP